jgi:hypothetical protein
MRQGLNRSLLVQPGQVVMPLEGFDSCARVAAVLNWSKALPVSLWVCFVMLSCPALAEEGSGAGGEAPAPVAESVAVLAPPSAAELETLATELKLAEGGESALLVYSSGAFDVLRIGTRLLAPESPEAGRGVRQIVRGLKEGIVSVELATGERSWEGQVQVLSGVVSLLDADILLGGEVRADNSAATNAAFDLFVFYDELDIRNSMTDKLSYCAEVLAGDLLGADRTLVQQACGRFERRVEEEQRRVEELQRLVEDPDQLVAELIDDSHSDEPAFADQPLLYQADGTLRRRPRGTIVRALAGGSAFALAGGSLVGVFYWEYRAQQEYLLFRNAEQFGEDTAMTEHFFYTQEHDRQRNGAIAVATAALTAGVFAMIWQRLEAERFRKARASQRGSKTGDVQ